MVVCDDEDEVRLVAIGSRLCPSFVRIGDIMTTVPRHYARQHGREEKSEGDITKENHLKTVDEGREGVCRCTAGQTCCERVALCMQFPADMGPLMVRVWTAGPSNFKMFGEPSCAYPGMTLHMNQPGVTVVMLSAETPPCAGVAQ